MNITVKKTLKYTTLPGLIPRIGTLFFSGFSHIALYMAFVFSGTKLLQPNHPYLNPDNIGRFGIRHVLAEAASNLVFDRKHADQVAVFVLFLTGIVILTMQFALLILAYLVPQAHASFGDYVASFFVTPAPTYDIAFMLLDYVFGIPGMFDSCVSQPLVPCVPPSGLSWILPAIMGLPTAPPFPSPTHEALHLLFHFYNTGVLAIGLIILLYFVVVMVAETAQSGTPFGRRFNRLWMPLRLIFAVAIIVPILGGFNMAQIMTLRMAKWGSGLATNGWTLFNSSLVGSTLLGDQANLVATPNIPSVNSLVEFMFVAQACKHAELIMHGRVIRPYLVKDETQPALFMQVPAAGPLDETTFENAVDYFNNEDFLIRFGELDPDVTTVAPPLLGTPQTPRMFKNEKGYVSPTCGEIIFNIQDVEELGGIQIQKSYYNLIKELWLDSWNDMYAEAIVLMTLPHANKDPFALVNMPMAQRDYIDWTIDYFQQRVDNAVQLGVAAALANPKWLFDLYLYGWGGAGIWYNKVAQLNGSIYSSTFSLPKANKYPLIMEHIKEQRKQSDEIISQRTQYAPYQSDKDQINYQFATEEYISLALYNAQSFWFDPTDHEIEDNPFLDTISLIFGLDGLFNMYENTDIHPLAQLVGIGRSLIEHTVATLALGTGSAVASKVFDKSGLGTFSKAAADLFFKIAMVGGILGFILFYVIPFMPFIYFFFAVGGWIKGIFEAMVGMPLFALAHLRIDGNGLPGPVAMNGYFLLLEILLRPIMIVFGLLASIAIFSAQVQVLHSIFPLVTSNLTGFDHQTPTAFGMGSIEFLRSQVDQLFHTIIYAIIVYMLGVANFKLVDLIPNFILRWLNAGVSTFGEKTQDPAGSVVRNMFYGAQMVVGQTSGAMMGLLGRNG